MRTTLCATVVALMFCATAQAEQLLGSIHKIENGKITVAQLTKDGKGKKRVLKVAKKVTVKRLKINLAKRKFENSKPFPDGLKNNVFKQIPKRGLPAQIVTNKNDEVTSITLFPKGFKIRVTPKKKKEKK